MFVVSDWIILGLSWDEWSAPYDDPSNLYAPNSDFFVVENGPLFLLFLRRHCQMDDSSNQSRFVLRRPCAPKTNSDPKEGTRSPIILFVVNLSCSRYMHFTFNINVSQLILL
jgi:hypothetical protein